MIKTKEQLQAIRKDIEKALAEITAKHGINEFKIGTIRHDDSGFKTTLDAQYQGAESADMKTLKFNAEFMGFKKEIAGAEITYSNKKFTVIGMKRTKLILEGEEGKSYSANIEDVKRNLRNQKSQYVI